jgi:hypothetical protein
MGEAGGAERKRERERERELKGRTEKRVDSGCAEGRERTDAVCGRRRRHNWAQLIAKCQTASQRSVAGDE